MATYDTFLDPASGEEHQSKAFGKGMRTYRAGDTARIQRAPMSAQELAEVRAGTWDPRIPDSEVATVQVRLVRGGDEQKYIDIIRGVFVGIRVERDTCVPLVDHYGRIVDE